ncbi:hypothetical protein PR048_001919 [Dryococelus australis]|uniref:Reverse transcriptase/retrotransposon-derived protein RNase H-like domain-containing protein n=1 Tax=Dryococelus australis TaxID=614101 RepID=A0ABQ9IK67_9NEOP|nr:hypothetical protein PR048_001919 [Dryococelus australis]
MDQNCISTQVNEVKTVQNAPKPLNYYSKFLPCLAMIMAPLYALLKDSCKWNWLVQCNDAFATVKEILTSSNVLAHNDPNLPVLLACDASPYGLGAVISHVIRLGMRDQLFLHRAHLPKLNRITLRLIMRHW